MRLGGRGGEDVGGGARFHGHGNGHRAMALEIRGPRTVEAEYQRSRIRVLDNNVNAAARLRDDEAPRSVELVRHTRKQDAGQVGGHAQVHDAQGRGGAAGHPKH